MRNGWMIGGKDGIGRCEWGSVRIVWRDLYKEWEIRGRVWNQQVFGAFPLLRVDFTSKRRKMAVSQMSFVTRSQPRLIAAWCRFALI